MPIFELYSKRQKRLRGEAPDVFEYDNIPQSLRIQIVHIWRDAIGESNRGTTYTHAHNLYKQIHDILCREYGMYQLMADSRGGYSRDLAKYFELCEDNEKVLDVIELTFHAIQRITKDSEYRHYTNPRSTPEEAIKELNGRFLEHGVGYQFESGQIIRKDSELLHSEVVNPTLKFLSANEYSGANEEFLKAHEHYRHRNYKECLNECLKSFESTMKTICHKRGWSYNQTDTAKKLIEICFDNGLIPSFLQTQVTALKSVLESGVPTVRNKLGGHGQGAQQTTVPQHFASYALHLTATTILFLVQLEEELPY